MVLLVLAVLFGVWELFARQVPGSIFHVNTLPGPLSSLRNTATTLALVLLAAAWLLPWAYASQEPRLMVVLAYMGAALSLGAGLYGVLNGMYGIQITDPRPDATPLFVLKSAGSALLAACLLDLCWRILSRPPPSS